MSRVGHTLVYLLAHASPDASPASFDAFRQDPDGIKARDGSEANGKLLIAGGVKSRFLVPLLSSVLQSNHVASNQDPAYSERS